ncbi:MAG: CpaF family protein [Phycisphaeraceae bacterium]|nr:CpaF family protein [Phycisphaeraceae bacterium]
MTDSLDGHAADRGLAELRRRMHERLLDSMDFGAAIRMSKEQLFVECSSRVQDMLERSGHPLNADVRRRLIREVLDEVFGLGPLEPLFEDDEISDILVNGPDQIFVERLGVLRPAGVRFRDADHVMNVVQRIVRNSGRRLDERSSMVDVRLADGSRVNVIIPPLALEGPQLSIRRFSGVPFDLERLQGFGAMSPETGRLLRAAVSGRLNIVISGGAGVGKTTLLNALSADIGGRERVITIEDAAELQLLGSHVVRLETRPVNLEGIGEIDARALVRNALRMRPDRIIVGECRGAEAFDMLQAMNTGHDGSMTTLHANSAKDAAHRLESMLSMSGFDVPIGVLRDYIASAIDLVVHMVRLPDGRRIIGDVSEVRTHDGERIALESLHRFRLDGVIDGRTEGAFETTGVIPGFLERLRGRGVEIDPSLFDAGERPVEIVS